MLRRFLFEVVTLRSAEDGNERRRRLGRLQSVQPLRTSSSKKTPPRHLRSPVPGRLLSNSMDWCRSSIAMPLSPLDEDFSQDIEAIIKSHRDSLLKKVEKSRFLAD